MERICRLCLQDGPNLGLIEDYAVDWADQNEAEPEDFSQLILRYLSIQVVKQEPTSDTVICSSCRSAILDWHNFRECCLRNDGIYLKLLSEVSSVDQELLLGLNTAKHVIRTDKPKQEEVTEDYQEPIDNENRNSSPIDFYEVEIEERGGSTSYDNDHEQQPEQESIEEFPSKIPLKKRGRPRKERVNREPCVKQQPNASEVVKTGKKRGRPKLAVKTERRAEVCPMCGKFIKNMSEHMRIHNNEKRHQCPFCPKAFVSASNYSSHVNIHTRAKMYKCDLCDKQYPMLNGLKQHRITHFKERVYLCPVCGKAYYQPTGLARHKRTHFEEPKIKCSECDKMFLSNGDLRKHFTKHLDEKPFACEICSRAFRRKDNLVTHMKTHRLNAKQGSATVLQSDVPPSNEQSVEAEG
ncbi:zinc finger and SCAN domain-containing protein 12-like [Wyeomyia smithii]|uniref:zinc finger and SCAN domain-containing protein 12-like n=1 Tax=Wyeomyia smithii TaxID=174621 RepID=UPI00246817FB|nr:zinc finger and SCAN domain-containing protein 12-like [Wyeomyia smithii]